MKKTNGGKNIIIVGSGKLGMFIANDYSLNNDNIVLIDKDENILKIANMRFGARLLQVMRPILIRLLGQG